MRLFAIALFAVLVGENLVRAQDRAEEAKKQLAVVGAAWKQAELSKMNTSETADLIVVTSLPDAKVKSLALAGQKAYNLAWKTLQYEETDKPWPGKLTIIYFDKRDDYTKYMRKVVLEKPSPKETARLMLRGTEPTVLVVLASDAKGTDDELFTEMVNAVSLALLKHKSGATAPSAGNFDLPDWLTFGFSRNILGRLEGQAVKLTAYRAKVRPIALARLPKGSAVLTAQSLWTGERPKEFDAMAVSLVEYFAFGPENMRFTKLIIGFRPGENGEVPTTDKALELLELKWDALDKSWKSWIVKGK